MSLTLKILPLSLNVRAVSLAEGFRAGIAVAVTVLAGEALNLPHFGLAALGALLTCFADPGGPVRRRAPAVVAFAICSGLAYGAFGLIRAEGPFIAAPLAGLAIFCACYARVYGQGGLQVGNLLSVVIVLALDYPAHSIAQAAAQGLNIAAGAGWAALLTLVIWQIHPYGPARRALAEVAQKLSLLAKDLARLANAEESPAAFEAHAARHRRSVRDAIETARGVALDTFRRRGVVTGRAAQLTIRLQTCEQIFGGLIALSDILDNTPAARAPTARAIRLIAGWLAALGPAIEAGKTLETQRKQASLDRLRAAIATLPETLPRRHVLDAIAENLAAIVNVSSPGPVPAAGAAPLRARVLAPLRQNFSFGSAPMRHALRAGLIATPVLVFTMSIQEQFAHWATITMLLCLQPYFSATWDRSAERIAGTALGGAVAAAIGLLSQTPLQLALTMLPLTMFAFAIRGVSYGAFIAALTPMVVLLVEQIVPGTNELHLALARIGYTFLGGTLAVLGNLLLFPGFEATRVETSIAKTVAAHAAYAQAVFAALLDGTPAPDAARRAAGMASNNLEASLARALAEPHKGGDALIERGAVVDAALRRMAGRLSVLALDRPKIPPEARPLWQDWQIWLASSFAGKPPPRPPLPAGPAADTLTRLARQVELISR